MQNRYLLFFGLLCALALPACQLRGPSNEQASVNATASLPVSTAIVFQADLVNCKRSQINLYRQTGPTDYVPVDRITLVNKAVPEGNSDQFDARERANAVHVRAMVPGKYHIRSISCGHKMPRDEFAIGSFDVIEGRIAYLGRLVVGKRDGRVLLRVDNEAESAYNDVRDRYPGDVQRYGVRLLVSNIPLPG